MKNLRSSINIKFGFSLELFLHYSRLVLLIHEQLYLSWRANKKNNRKLKFHISIAKFLGDKCLLHR